MAGVAPSPARAPPRGDLPHVHTPTLTLYVKKKATLKKVTMKQLPASRHNSVGLSLLALLAVTRGASLPRPNVRVAARATLPSPYPS
jgi:hypothetical protein